MGNVLAFCEFHDAALRTRRSPTWRSRGRPRQAHGGEVDRAAVGKGAPAAGADAASYATKVVVVDDAALEHYLAETYAPVLARLAGEHGATVCRATATTTGKDLMPRAAALLDAGQASDVSKLAANQFVRPILAGNAYSTVEISTPIIVRDRAPVGVRGGCCRTSPRWWTTFASTVGSRPRA